MIKKVKLMQKKFFWTLIITSLDLKVDFKLKEVLIKHKSILNLELKQGTFIYFVRLWSFWIKVFPGLILHISSEVS